MYMDFTELCIQVVTNAIKLLLIGRLIMKAYFCLVMTCNVCYM